MSTEDDFLPLKDAVAKVVSTEYAASTIWRWAHRGFSNGDGTRTKLAVQYCGRHPTTTVRAVKEFMARITSAKGSTLAEHKMQDVAQRKLDESGSAFPETRPGGYGTTAGLTKLEYFAAAALANPAICNSTMMQHEQAKAALDVATLLVELLEVPQ